VEGNSIAGIGPTLLGYQIGIDVYNGASGVIKNNRIIDHCNTSGGYWSAGIFARPVGGTITPLKPLRIERNTFAGNQKHLLLIRGDNSQVINKIVTDIRYGAFSGCTSLTDITTPATLTQIWNYAFSDCAGLTALYFEGAPQVSSFSD
jgi:hypothetical protein